MKTIIKLPCVGDHVVHGDTVHLVEWHNDDYYFICCVREYRDRYKPRTLQVTVDAPVDCLLCISGDIELGETDDVDG